MVVWSARNECRSMISEKGPISNPLNLVREPRFPLGEINSFVTLTNVLEKYGNYKFMNLLQSYYKNNINNLTKLFF